MRHNIETLFHKMWQPDDIFSVPLASDFSKSPKSRPCESTLFLESQEVVEIFWD